MKYRSTRILPSYSLKCYTSPMSKLKQKATYDLVSNMSQQLQKGNSDGDDATSATRREQSHPTIAYYVLSNTTSSVQDEASIFKVQ